MLYPKTDLSPAIVEALQPNKEEVTETFNTVYFDDYGNIPGSRIKTQINNKSITPLRLERNDTKYYDLSKVKPKQWQNTILADRDNFRKSLSDETKTTIRTQL